MVTLSVWILVFVLMPICNKLADMNFENQYSVDKERPKAPQLLIKSINHGMKLWTIYFRNFKKNINTFKFSTMVKIYRQKSF